MKQIQIRFISLISEKKFEAIWAHPMADTADRVFWQQKSGAPHFSIGGLEQDYHGMNPNVVSGFYHRFKCDEIFGAPRKNCDIVNIITFATRGTQT